MLKLGGSDDNSVFFVHSKQFKWQEKRDFVNYHGRI